MGGYARNMARPVAALDPTRGKCSNCGYDLRGSAGRCPECGSLPDRASSQAEILEMFAPPPPRAVQRKSKTPYKRKKHLISWLVLWLICGLLMVGGWLDFIDYAALALWGQNITATVVSHNSYDDHGHTKYYLVYNFTVADATHTDSDYCSESTFHRLQDGDPIDILYIRSPWSHQDVTELVNRPEFHKLASSCCGTVGLLGFVAITSLFIVSWRTRASLVARGSAVIGRVKGKQAPETIAYEFTSAGKHGTGTSDVNGRLFDHLSIGDPAVVVFDPRDLTRSELFVGTAFEPAPTAAIAAARAADPKPAPPEKPPAQRMYLVTIYYKAPGSEDFRYNMQTEGDAEFACANFQVAAPNRGEAESSGRARFMGGPNGAMEISQINVTQLGGQTPIMVGTIQTGSNDRPANADGQQFLFGDPLSGTVQFGARPLKYGSEFWRVNADGTIESIIRTSDGKFVSQGFLAAQPSARTLHLIASPGQYDGPLWSVDDAGQITNLASTGDPDEDANRLLVRRPAGGLTVSSAIEGRPLLWCAMDH
jgi:hypothetical protein